MVEQMTFLSIVGPGDDLNRIARQYLGRYEMQLENALTQLKSSRKLYPFSDENPCRNQLQRALELEALLPPTKTDRSYGRNMGPPLSSPDTDWARETISRLDAALRGPLQKKEALEEEAKRWQEDRERLLPFQELDFSLEGIQSLQRISFSFGRIPEEKFPALQEEMDKALDIIYRICSRRDHFVYLLYLAPAPLRQKAEALASSLHFEPLSLPSGYEGAPARILEELAHREAWTREDLFRTEEEIRAILADHGPALREARSVLDSFDRQFSVRRLAACTGQKEGAFYILCGWMAKRDALLFQKELEEEENVFCLAEEDEANFLSPPPTRLKNPPLAQPFEMFIRMYGLPAYGEFDPTVLIAVTYSLLFGFMFGDVGQGLLLALGGLFLYRTRHLELAAILSCCGISSALFGLLFGSVFGFESLLPPLWLRPAKQMIHLPLVGRLNTVFIVSVALGMAITVLAMVLNIANGLRSHEARRFLLDANGAAGLLFYSGSLAILFLLLAGKGLPAMELLLLFLGLPLLAIFFKEPLGALLEKAGGRKEKKNQEKKEEPSLAMFLIQGIFETFEMLLSYFSNTLSFVRVGAFAVSHAAMMEVVIMLSGAEAGHMSWPVVILGNLFVCAMEGLVVGIQVLRLEYYEIFSRFYRGDGRQFTPYRITEQGTKDFIKK